MYFNRFLVDPARTWKYKETFIYVTFRVIRNVTTSFPIVLTRVGNKNFEGDLTPPEVFVGTEVFVELPQSDSDSEVFVGPDAGSTI